MTDFLVKPAASDASVDSNNQLTDGSTASFATIKDTNSKIMQNLDELSKAYSKKNNQIIQIQKNLLQFEGLVKVLVSQIAPFVSQPSG